MQYDSFVDILKSIEKGEEYKYSFLVSLGYDTYLQEFLYLIHKYKNFIDTYFKAGRIFALSKVTPEQQGRVTIDRHTFETSELKQEYEAVLNTLKILRDNLIKFIDAGKLVSTPEKFKEIFKQLNLNYVEIPKNKKKLLLPIFSHCSSCIDIIDKSIKDTQLKINKDKLIDVDAIKKANLLDYSYNEKLVQEIRYSIFKGNNLITSNEYKMVKQFIGLGDSISQIILTKEQYPAKLRNGDILLSYHLPNFLRKHMIPLLISKFTESCSVHSGIYFNGKIVDSNRYKKGDGCVRDRALYDQKDDVILVLRPKFSFDLNAMTKLFAEHTQKTDKGYKYAHDPFGAIALGIFVSTGWYPGFLKRKMAYFCSEYINSVYAQLGHPLTKYGFSSQYVSSKDVLESQVLDFVCMVDGTRELSQEIKEETKLQDIERLQQQFRAILEGEMGFAV